MRILPPLIQLGEFRFQILQRTLGRFKSVLSRCPSKNKGRFERTIAKTVDFSSSAVFLEFERKAELLPCAVSLNDIPYTTIYQNQQAERELI